jgi:outer membrane receptor protein involved in Fe transport
MPSSCLRVPIIAILGVFICAICPPTKYLAQAQTTPHALHVTGIVVDLNGAVIGGTQVSLKQGQRLLASTTTNAEGRFDLVANPSARLLIEVSSPGFDVAEVSLESTTPLPLRIVLTPQSVSAEVTITATRTATRLSETAASVTTLTNAELNTTAAATLDDALRQVAGFSLFRRSGSRTANPTSQGVSLRATGASGASRALVLADGVPLNDPFGGWIYWDRIPRESISQVEVLLGGASHLYGSAALGGVIEISTKRPTTNSLSLAASYGNETTPNFSVFGSATKDKWTGSLAAETFRADGYVLVPEDQRGTVDTAAGTRDVVINVRVERKVTNEGRLFAGASSFGESRENGTPLQTNRTHLRQFVFGGSWQPIHIGSISARIYGGSQVYDQNFSAISTDRNSETLTRVQRVPAQVFGISAQWSRLIGRRQTLVAGFEGREVRGASDEIVYVNGRASSLVGAGGRERDSGGYFEDLIRLGSHVFLNLGGRIDHWLNFAALSASRPVSAVNPSVTFFSDRTENAFSPHASFVYQFNDRVSLMASMSRAFRAPTLNELYRSFRVGNVLTLANENLRAERLTGGEAGLRVKSTNEKITMRGNFFWNDITRPVANVTLTTTPALITRQRQNLGRTRSRGVELQADAQLTRTWSLSSSYLLAAATVVEFPANKTLEGLWLPQVPRHQLTFQTQYQNPSIVTFALQGRASSSQFDDDQNQFRLGSYVTVDAFVSRRLNHRLEAFCAVENLLDQRYEVGKTPVTTLGPPILVRGGFRMTLGGK